MIPLFSLGLGNTGAHWDKLEEAVGGAIGAAMEEEVEDQVEVEAVEGGYVFRMADPMSFSLGDAEVSAEVAPLLRSIARVARVSEGAEVLVEGHTCDLPIHSERFASNWELSGARAAAVVRFLEAEGLGNSRMILRARGPYQPLVPNEDEPARRKNRRVEIRLTLKELTTP